MTITIADGRGALWQWDTGRRLRVGSGVSQIHYQNRVLGCSVDVDVGADGTAIIPDELLQDWHTLTAYAYVTDDTGAYTMVQQDFAVHKRAKPAGYVYTPTEQLTLQTIQRQIGDLADLTTEAKDTLVAAINEAARTGGGAGSMDLRVADGYIQYSTDSGSTWQNLIAIADLKGADGAPGTAGPAGAPGKDGHSPVVTATKSGKTTTISVDGAAIATVEDGADGAPGKDGADGKPGAAGADGITPHIGDNGNWYLGTTDTGKPSRGETGPQGTPGKDGAGMDITGATVGQIAKITAVDSDGKPTGWEPVDMVGDEELAWRSWDSITVPDGGISVFDFSTTGAGDRLTNHKIQGMFVYSPSTISGNAEATATLIVNGEYKFTLGTFTRTTMGALRLLLTVENRHLVVRYFKRDTDNAVEFPAVTLTINNLNLEYANTIIKNAVTLIGYDQTLKFFDAIKTVRIEATATVKKDTVFNVQVAY